MNSASERALSSSSIPGRSTTRPSAGISMRIPPGMEMAMARVRATTDVGGHPILLNILTLTASPQVE